MEKHYWDKIETIIDEVLTLPEQQRQSYINEKCKGNESLKSEVTLLLESIFDSEGWLDNPGDYKEALYSDISEELESTAHKQLVGKNIGSYTIRRELGQGGMGAVYLAERSDGAFKHNVAIKIIRNEKASSENLRRFKRERKILAGLNHPGIAKLFDGGITSDGFPYFVMEYIDGIPIDEYCKNKKYSVHNCIQLFKQVLEAVEHAHENFVVHRDLKPANILVDSSGKVKILDFGISKLIQEDQEPAPLLTQTGHLLFTPKYAAPEQILQSAITTATDIYALGIIFYQLISGKFPYQINQLSRFEIEQKILEETPNKPSIRAESQKNKKRLTGDLDAIALKAIRKEPEKRYRVANEFLDDLNRYEQGLPVLAHEGSTTYRFKKFIKRNKKRITIALVFFLCLSGLTGFYTSKINQQRKTAELEAKKANEVKNLLVKLFKASDPISGGKDSITLDQLLKKGTKQLLKGGINPGVRIELLLTLSKIYSNITNYDKANELAEESLKLSNQHFGLRSLNTAKSYLRLGSIKHELGNYKEGKAYFLKAKKILHGQLQVSDPVFAELYDHLGYSEEQLSDYKLSQKYFQKSLDILTSQSRIDSVEYISELRNVARAAWRSGENQKADSLLLLALKASKKVHGSDDVVTSSVMNDIGLFYMTQARYKEARDYYNRSLKIKKAVYGDKGHPNYSATLMNLAVLEETLGNLKVAESLFLRAMHMDIKISGENHPNVAMSKSYLGTIYFKMGKYEKSREYREQTLKMYLKIYGPNHSYLGRVYRDYGEILSVQGEYERAEKYFIKTDSIYTKYRSANENSFAKLHKLRGDNFYYMQKYKAATRELRLASETYNAISPQYYYYVRMAAKCRIKLAQSYIAMGNKKKALSIFNNLRVQMDTTKALVNYDEIDKLFTNAVKSL